MEHRRAALPSTEREPHALAELAREVQRARLQVLRPAVVSGTSLGFVLALWFLGSDLGAAVFEATRWHRYWAGSAVAASFAVPCASILYVGRLLYRRRLARVRSRWIDESVARLGLDRDAMETLSRLFV